MKEGIITHEGVKYLRTIHSAVSDKTIEVDIYAVLEAFDVTCPAIQHCIKKLLAAGQRGKGTKEQDLIGAKAALNRAIELEKERNHSNNIRMSLKEAQERGVCRICGMPQQAGPGFPFLTDFGKEFAHEKCLKDAKE